MSKNNFAKVHHGHLVLLLKIICLCLLLAFPIKLNADPNDDQTNLDYWPPVIQKLEQAHAQSPQDINTTNSLANAYNNYGVLLARNNQWSQAEENLQKAISLSSNPAPIKSNLSNVYFSHGYALYQNRSAAGVSTYAHEDSKQLANQAIALDPNNANAYLLLGDIEYMAQNMPAAERAWQQAATLVPNNQDVQKRLQQIKRESVVETDMNSIFNPYFNIKVDQSVAQNPNFDINGILTFVYDNVAPDFQYIQNEKVPVVVYNSDEYHQTMIDAPGWAEAIYDGKIRITITADQKSFRQLTSDIVHEYTHVIVGALTDNNCPRWFNEGLAKYEEYKHGVSPRIYLLATAYNDNSILSFDTLNDALVSPNKNEALLAYQQSFSFVYYLIQRYGMNDIVELLKTLGKHVEFATAMQQVYATPLATIENNWRLWLADFITNWADAPNQEAALLKYQNHLAFANPADLHSDL